MTATLTMADFDLSTRSRHRLHLALYRPSSGTISTLRSTGQASSLFFDCTAFRCDYCCRARR